MIQINSLKTLENIANYYYINENLQIINIETGHIKKATLGKRGYYYVTLSSKQGRQTKVYLHKIIALAFIKNENYEVINHKDGNKLNNNVSNLEFVSQKENIRHSWKYGMTKRKESDFIVKTENHYTYQGTMKELAIKMNIPRQTLYDLYYNKRGSKQHHIQSITKVNRLSNE